MEIKEQVKRSVSITDVVSLYVSLKPAGKNLKGLCPFHTEKTPSFFVMPEKDTFACYGCNKFGDTFTFIQDIENLSFPEAVNFLIDKFNIPVERDKNRSSGVKKDVYARINEKALKYFRDNLLDSPEGKNAGQYLTKRGISRKTIELFNLGYAQNQWDGLYSYLRKQSCDIEKAIELGLLVKSQSHRIYDRFRGRIIFPIYSDSDPRTPIAFGGRTLFDDPAKYLNSPDTPLYKKSKHLYGFHLSKKMARESNKAILVEGYFDMISLFQNGIENVAASLGTALTENQVNLLARFANQIYLFYDNDKAGIEATLRAIEKMFEQNINPQVISDPHAPTKDPDDFIREKGIKAFNQLLENATDGFRFLIGCIAQKYDLRVPEKKYEAVQSILTTVNKFGEAMIRDEYIRKLADFFQVAEHTLRAKAKENPQANITTAAPQHLRITPAENIFIEDVIAQPELIGEVKELLSEELLSVLPSRNIIRLLFQHFNRDKGGTIDFSGVFMELSDAERGELMRIYDQARGTQKNREQLEKEIESCIVEFQFLLNRRKVRRINQEIKLAARSNNINKIEQLIREKTLFIKSRYNTTNYNSNLIEGAVD